jgi:DNA polymerase-3 subunit epsilon
MGPVDKELSVSVDRFAIVQTMVLLVGLLKKAGKGEAYQCRMERLTGYLAFDLTWKGDPLPMDILHQWGQKVISFESQGGAITLADILTYHNGEMWPIKTGDPAQPVGLRIILPDIAGEESDTHRDLAIVPDSRPEFYDFDLFHQPGQVPELDNQPLDELTYTVFDTETTGLNPAAGDEIISIGAVRIVNNRILAHERFEQLVNPMKKLSWESIQIHGIVDDMLADQPLIDKVLPRFERFARGTVLVAHNAAFDMRMLQLKEKTTGIQFDNPVLDTMLLSAVVHPAHDNHNLTAIARRLGIDITGRHTAIGDAIATGEILLKLIPLLAKKGIHTLKTAREASEQTYYARLKY